MAKFSHNNLRLQVDWLQILLMQSQHSCLQKTRTLPLAKIFFNTGQKVGGTESFPFPFLSYPFSALKLSLNNLSWNFETFPQGKNHAMIEPTTKKDTSDTEECLYCEP